jgi:hypothetical protein
MSSILDVLPKGVKRLSTSFRYIDPGLRYPEATGCFFVVRCVGRSSIPRSQAMADDDSGLAGVTIVGPSSREHSKDILSPYCSDSASIEACKVTSKARPAPAKKPLARPSLDQNCVGLDGNPHSICGVATSHLYCTLQPLLSVVDSSKLANEPRSLEPLLFQRIQRNLPLIIIRSLSPTQAFPLHTLDFIHANRVR